MRTSLAHGASLTEFVCAAVWYRSGRTRCEPLLVSAAAAAAPARTAPWRESGMAQVPALSAWQLGALDLALNLPSWPYDD